MLARSFLSAEQLGLEEVEHGALIKVLHMLERGELAAFAPDKLTGNTFDMGSWKNTIFQLDEHDAIHSCHTAGCIAGWAHVVSDGKAFEFVGRLEVCPCEGALRDLFVPFEGTPGGPATINARMRRISPGQGAAALSNYLTTGEPRWSEALAEVA